MDRKLTGPIEWWLNQTIDKATETKDKAKDKAVALFNDTKTRSVQTKDRAIVILRNPEFQKATLCTTGGSITFGAVGGAFGLASGVVVGSTVGLVPALFTFGLSIPVGGAIGGVGGLCTGTLIGGASGGAAGFTVYKYRIEITKATWTVKVKTYELLDKAKTEAIKKYNGVSSRTIKAYNGATHAVSVRAYKFQVSVNDLANKAKKDSRAALALAKLKASQAYQVTTESRAGVTTASAVTGAVVGGTSGGAFGTVAGAAVGIVPAIFTFGLSIPAGAMIGLCAGTTIGGSAGAVGGGVVGYTGYTVKQNYGKAIAESFQSSLSKAGNLKNKTFMRAAEAKESMKSMVKGSTGGSGHDKTD